MGDVPNASHVNLHHANWPRPAPAAGLSLSRRPCFDPPMARTSTRNVNPSLSSDPRDKLLAALY